MMPLSKDSFSKIPTCYATVSVGTPDHPLDKKLEAIAAAGFQGIELGFPDLLSFASKNLGKEVGPQDFEVLCTAGLEVKRMCEELGLKIVMLQPFSNFEGWKPQSEERKDAFRRAKGWIKIMEAVGTDMLQVIGPDASNLARLTQPFCRLALPILPSPPLEMSSPQISNNSPIYSLPTISALHTRIGAGLHTLRIGKMSGK